MTLNLTSVTVWIGLVLSFILVKLLKERGLRLQIRSQPTSNETPRSPTIAEKGPESTSTTPSEEDHPSGEWRPVDFSYPSFGPDVSFNIETTKAPLYRPFRWGNY
jgi:hypothetical protein